MTLNLDKNKKSAGTTLVTFLLDRSGSMENGKGATIDAFNSYISSMQEERSDGFKCEFTFLTFDDISLDKIHVCEPIRNVNRLNIHTYQPRGGTPLIDSCMQTILALEDSLRSRDDNPKIVVCFQTDGAENMSRKYRTDELKRKIETCQAKGWQFNFMGAGLDGYSIATQMGIGHANTMSYDRHDYGRTLQAFAANAVNTRNYGIGATGSTAYMMSQRADAGDAFVPADLKVDVDVKVQAPVAPKDAKLNLTQ